MTMHHSSHIKPDIGLPSMNIIKGSALWKITKRLEMDFRGMLSYV